MGKSIVLLVALLAFVSSEAKGTYSLNFSTGGIDDYSWTVEVSGGTATMIFQNNEVDTSNPSPDPVVNDMINLPSMVMSNLQKTTVAGIEIITGDLTPDGNPLTITADVASSPAIANELVMSAAAGQGGLLTIGTNFIAYSSKQDDLNLDYILPDYSVVIDGFAWAEANGFDLDLSFSGDAAASLFDLLDTPLNDGSVSGTMSGQIIAIPEPLSLTLLGLGGLALLRKRR